MESEDRTEGECEEDKEMDEILVHWAFRGILTPPDPSFPIQCTSMS